jgi:hypothetical protein
MAMGENITQPIQHHAEELGQSRAYAKTEAVGIFVAACLAGLWAGLAVLAIGVGYWLYTERGFWPAFFILALPAGVLAGGGVVLIKGLHEQIDGLRAWREVTTYYPPQPEVAQLPHPPIKVFPPGKKEPYLLTEPETPGRETLRLTPPVIAEIVQGVVEKYDGKWSRRKLTRLTVAGGQKVSRSLYETLTNWFDRAGVLERTPQGGFELVTKDLGELRDVFPGLSIGGQVGGQPGDRAGDGAQDILPTGGAVGNLAEQRRQQFLECGCDVKDYLRRRDDG